MAPKTRITRKMILDAGFNIVREKGHEALNVRAIAKHLGCSTQPVLYSFQTMEEIHREVYYQADLFHTEYIMSGAEGSDSPLLSIGLAYIRFGAEEPHLFRYLFQTNHFRDMDIDTMVSAPDAAPLIAVTADEFGCSKEQALERFRIMFIFVHGSASLLANNAMSYDAEKTEIMLKSIFNQAAIRD